MRLRSPVAATALTLLAVACGNGDVPDPPPDPAGPVLGEDRVQAFTQARIFDGTGGPLIDDGVVVVRGGVISEVGPAHQVSVPEDAEVVDLGGRFLFPGFINTHGHVGPDGDRADIREQLEIYAHYGVTTVLSLGDEAQVPEGPRWSPRLDRARLFVSGPSLSPASPEEAEAEVERVVAMGADWVKMHVNSPLSRTTHPAIISAARDRMVPVAIHIEELADAKAVVEAGATLLGHSVRDVPVDEELMRMMRERDVCLVPTLTRELSTFVYAERPDFFDDPFFLERSAPDDLEDFVTPQRQAQAGSESARYWQDALPLAMENMVRLHEAGVGIGMGTDSGPTGRFQGYFEHLEMEMMVDAGMSPQAVLISATGEAARCIGLEGIIGTVHPGVWADLVALDADPREEIRNTREIHGVWIAGNRVR